MTSNSVTAAVALLVTLKVVGPAVAAMLRGAHPSSDRVTSIVFGPLLALSDDDADADVADDVAVDTLALDEHAAARAAMTNGATTSGPRDKGTSMV
jgi:hypothetical protein